MYEEKACALTFLSVANGVLLEASKIFCNKIDFFWKLVKFSARETFGFKS